MIGTGWIAHEMADALNAVNGEIYGVSDMNAEQMAKFAAANLQLKCNTK